MLWSNFTPNVVAGLSFRSFDINKVLEFGSLLLASGPLASISITTNAMFEVCSPKHVQADVCHAYQILKRVDSKLKISLSSCMMVLLTIT
ncbi:hypothetical protein IHE45_14G054700 [Dioscorea alata]|uniref:Uncharacterized protein n=1 Tax=Dioscorea alata TaxID=55571 RepID=A0ACB7URT5_DIOAL|nr:hypothetical protein IHE45_14G054700 [Dioscorea alata]